MGNDKTVTIKEEPMTPPPHENVDDQAAKENGCLEKGYRNGDFIMFQAPGDQR